MAKVCSIIRANFRIIQPRCSQSSLAAGLNVWWTNPYHLRKSPLPASLHSSRAIPAQQLRFYTSKPDDNEDADPKVDTLPDIMKLPTSFYWLAGSLFDALMVWLQQKIALPIIDRDFNPDEFLDGALQAMEIVSARLANREYDQLESLIAPDALEEIKNNVDGMTDEQRCRIPITVDDIYNRKIGKIEITTDNTCKPPEHMVSILVLAMAVRNESNVVNNDEDAESNNR